MTKTSLTAGRKKVPPPIEAQVLIQSRRRCCLCFHLYGDMGVKSGQVAHINQKRNDNDEGNLAFLCFDHHDDYDSIRSQSKGITALEIIHAKTALYSTLFAQLNPETVKITVSIEGDFNKLLPQERDALLAKALTAAQVQGKVGVLNVAPGSIKFTLEVGPDDAVLILSAFQKQKLNAVGVTDVCLGSNRRKDITFSKSFKKYHHGVSRSEALDVLLQSDSAIQIGEPNHYLMGVGLYLKRITERYSILLLATSAATADVGFAFPISHSDIQFSTGADPLQVLRMFLDRYGIELTFDARRSSLWMNDKIHVPFGVRTYPDLVSYLERTTEENTSEQYEFVGLFDNSNIVSNVASIRLMFAISKDRYYPSLQRLGLNFTRGKVGRHISHHYEA